MRSRVAWPWARDAQGVLWHRGSCGPGAVQTQAKARGNIRPGGRGGEGRGWDGGRLRVRAALSCARSSMTAVAQYPTKLGQNQGQGAQRLIESSFALC